MAAEFGFAESSPPLKDGDPVYWDGQQYVQRQETPPTDPPSPPPSPEPRSRRPSGSRASSCHRRAPSSPPRWTWPGA
jgi:hypothetical protein